MPICRGDAQCELLQLSKWNWGEGGHSSAIIRQRPRASGSDKGCGNPGRCSVRPPNTAGACPNITTAQGVELSTLAPRLERASRESPNPDASRCLPPQLSAQLPGVQMPPAALERTKFAPNFSHAPRFASFLDGAKTKRCVFPPRNVTSSGRELESSIYGESR